MKHVNQVVIEGAITNIVNNNGIHLLLSSNRDSNITRIPVKLEYCLPPETVDKLQIGNNIRAVGRISRANFPEMEGDVGVIAEYIEFISGYDGRD